MPDGPSPVVPAYIGPYRIVAPIGRGGMGVVYRGFDPRLNRDVAIKVLSRPEDATPAQTRRFMTEARAAGALNHPHIVAVHDVGTDDGQPYLVTELIDGHSLRHEIERGPLSLDRALDLAAQIASGLAAAHGAGLVHRDLKPDNVMITRDGRAKIVDFGLAKGVASHEQGVPTQTITAPHTIVGTASYMSPEQARGAEVDFRSDIFSFGVVLYEMLTGRRAFDRPSGIETLAAILQEPAPSLAETAIHVPPEVRRVVERCLAKAPADRYAATADLWHDLNWLRDRGDRRPVGVSIVGQPERRWLGLATAMGVAAVAALGLGWWASTREAGANGGPLPNWQQLTFERGLVASARFGIDGKTVIYGAAWKGQPFRLFTTTTASPESRELELPPATILAVSATGELAISLDCEFVPAAGTCRGTLARAPLLGGAPRPLAEGIRMADWDADGRLATARLDAASPESLRVEYPPWGTLTGRGSGHVRVAPRGNRVAWTETTDDGMGASLVMLRDAGGARVISQGWTFISGVAWAPDGESLYVSGLGPESRDDTVLKLSLDGRARVALRGPRRIRVLDAGPGGRLLVARDENFRLLTSYGAADNWAPIDISWLRDSTLDALSWDGRTALFTQRVLSLARGDLLFPVYAQPTSGGNATEIGSGYGLDISPDGRWALTRTRPVNGPADLVLVPLGPGEPRTLPRDPIDSGAGTSIAVFAGNAQIIFRGREGAGSWRTYLQDLNGGAPRLLGHEPGVVASPVTADGRFFASVRVDGTLWVASLEPGSARPLPTIFNPADRLLQWSPDGRQLWVGTLRGRDVELSRVEVATGRRSPVRVIPAADATAYINPSLHRIAIARDGARVVRGDSYLTSHLFLVDGIP